MNHRHIINLGYILGYFPNDNGVCTGIAYSYIEAALTQTIEAFEYLVNEITQAGENQEKLDALITVFSKSKKEPQDESALEIFAFLERISLYKYYDTYWDFFDANMTHYNNTQILSNSASSLITERNGGLTILSSQNGIFTLPELTEFLSKLSVIFNQIKHSTAPNIIALEIESCTHAIGLSYDAISEQYSLMDSNISELITGDIRTIAETIFSSLQSDTPSNFRLLHIKVISLNNFQFNAALQDSLEQFKQRRLLKLNKEVASRTEDDNNLASMCLNQGDIEAFQKLYRLGADLNSYNENQNKMIYLAIENNFLKILNTLIKNKADINKTNKNNFTPLCHAVKFKNIEAVKILIRAGANINPAIVIQPIHLAAKYGHTEILKLLINNNANIEAEDAQNDTALIYAVKNNQEQACEILIKAGADVNRYNQSHQNPLIIATINNNRKIVELLLTSKAKIDYTDNAYNTALHYAVVTGNHEIITILLNYQANPEYQNDRYETALMCAVEYNQPTACRLLLEAGADVNEVDDCAISSLHRAVEKNNLEILEILISNGANVNCADNNLRTPMHIAAELGHENILKKLLDNQADPNVQTTHKLTPLHLAIIHDQPKIAAMLLRDKNYIPLILTPENFSLHFPANFAAHFAAQYNFVDLMQLLMTVEDFNPGYKNNAGLTPLHIAIQYDNQEIISMLVNDDNININVEDNNGDTPLMYAICKQSSQACEILINAGADINYSNPYTLDTAAHYVSRHNIVEMLHVIIHAQADLNISNKNQETPLLIASQLGHGEIIRILLDNKVSPNTHNQSKLSPLHMAIMYNQPHVITTLLNAKNYIHENISPGIFPAHFAAQYNLIDLMQILIASNDFDCEQQDIHGLTPLHIAAKYNNKEIIKILVQQAKANIQAVDNDKNSALIHAVSCNHVEMCTLLIHLGAKTDIHNKESNTPIHIAVVKGNQEILAILLENGAEIEIKDKYNNTPLIHAIHFNNAQMCEMLIHAGADINKFDDNGLTPLHIAVDNNYIEILRLLIHKGADINRTKGIPHFTDVSCDSTPMHLAIKNGHLEVIKILIQSGANLNIQNAMGETPFMQAVIKDKKEIVDLLLLENQNIDPMSENNQKYLPLHFAAKYNLVSLMQTLLNKPQNNINALNKRNKTALQIAIKYEHIDIVTMLLEANADIPKHDDNCLPVHFAAKYNIVNLMQKFIEQEAFNPNSLNLEQMTPLHLAVICNHEQITEMLLMAHANPNLEDVHGTTPIMYAVINNNPFICCSLINFNAEINQVTSLNLSAVSLARHLEQYAMSSMLETAHELKQEEQIIMPLHIAAQTGYVEFMQKLFARGNINLDALDQQGQTPLLIAVCNNDFDICEMLIDGGANINIKYNNNYTIAHFAIMSNNLALLYKLIQTEPRIKNIAEGRGMTLLHLAAAIGNEEITDFLILAGANIEITDQQGNTPLLYAALFNQDATAYTLLKAGANINHTNQSSQSAVHLAIMKKDSLILLGLLLAQKANVNVQDNNGCTPLHLAIQAKQPQNVVSALLRKNIDITITDRVGNTALNYAQQSNNKDIIMLLQGRQGVSIDNKTTSISQSLFNRNTKSNALTRKPAVASPRTEKSATTHALAKQSLLKAHRKTITNKNASNSQGTSCKK